MRRYLRDPTFSSFDTIPECDRQTDTHRHTTMAYTVASHGKKSRWRTAAILKIVKCDISSRSTDFCEIWYYDAYKSSKLDEPPKIYKFENPRWRMAAVLKIEKSRFSEIVREILTKLCMMTH